MKPNRVGQTAHRKSKIVYDEAQYTEIEIKQVVRYKIHEKRGVSYGNEDRERERVGTARETETAIKEASSAYIFFCIDDNNFNVDHIKILLSFNQFDSQTERHHICM